MIRFESVSKVYKHNPVIENMNLEIDKGELVVLIGPSGCGKTTTLKMINRLVKPTSGKIYINGTDTEDRDVIELRRTMGYVIQQTGLFPHLTVKENIEIIPRLEKRNVNKIEARTVELMEMIGLSPDEFLYRYPIQLSGGQLQRIGVARAFATDPEIILMDEPFSALDPISRSQLQIELVNLQAQLKKTIVFVTHDMAEAIKIADKICIFNKGEIVQYDTPENILKNPVDEYVSNFVGRNRIWSIPELIKARDIMITNPITSTDSLSLLKCIELMRFNRVDSVLVVDAQNHMVGIITARMIQLEKDLSKTLGEIMRTEFLSAKPDDSIVDLLKTVQEKKISYIPVLGEDRLLLGLITTTSLVTTLSQQFIGLEEEGE
ncbi:MAG TPA: ABC transporter ATP-binding protein [Pseudoflavonifractor sp.]|nr:ABC transporter ATP-binding protein [Pseudoflavonifractor sp.]